MSNLPAPEALRALIAERRLSNRKLARLTDEVNAPARGLSPGHIGNIARGADRPSLAALALIARAAGVAPSYFVEHRLWNARSRLDERVVGVEEALAAFNRVQALLDLEEAAAEAQRRFG
ncbi:hypothetical protein Q5424_23235 [Conexibacter sp. JD483]|uniref:hypothetical protein n=1 Tax=unclassified Conexibacter TaxID=2627773 RepID=UPI0027185DEF|nr:MULTISPECIES: hypothetical protein [unclassified Conexibacter]MDO8184900.1 hypothetical protein [Conexibacter sp. CPCC 205706]MDO8198044.1 hypothetical protein [Conexibacter sp. CPCC 205762]MDR9372031.1 hypothetical protein [Conexibacter sp. JD483]